MVEGVPHPVGNSTLPAVRPAGSQQLPDRRIKAHANPVQPQCGTRFTTWVAAESVVSDLNSCYITVSPQHVRHQCQQLEPMIPQLHRCNNTTPSQKSSSMLCSYTPEARRSAFYNTCTPRYSAHVRCLIVTCPARVVVALWYCVHNIAIAIKHLVLVHRQLIIQDALVPAGVPVPAAKQVGRTAVADEGSTY
jgi:hypothetical protein